MFHMEVYHDAHNFVGSSNGSGLGHSLFNYKMLVCVVIDTSLSLLSLWLGILLDSGESFPALNTVV